MPNHTSRRTVLKNLIVGTAALSTTGTSSFASCDNKSTFNLKNNINHSVCYWTYNFLSVEELCKAIKEIGFSAMDLVGPKDWPTLQKYNVYSSMCYTAGENSLTKGWND
ncbi:MAG: hydroxypyruvate isomerase, partial [Flavisolibacter sp.]|nr:hydroxypyruvate isomerase [Flavisolibacter sp.]